VVGEGLEIGGFGLFVAGARIHHHTLVKLTRDWVGIGISPPLGFGGFFNWGLDFFLCFFFFFFFFGFGQGRDISLQLKSEIRL